MRSESRHVHVGHEIQPEGAPPFDLPAQPAVFAPGPEPEEIAGIAARLRQAAGLPSEPTGVVADNAGNGVMKKVKDAVS
jgi:hypothetical protein